MGFCTFQIIDTGAGAPAVGTILPGAASIGVQNLGAGDATFNGITISPSAPGFTVIAEKNGLFGSIPYDQGAGRLFIVVNRPAGS